MEPSEHGPDFCPDCTEYLKYPSPEWFRFRLLCKRELGKMLFYGHSCSKTEENQECLLCSDIKTLMKVILEGHNPEWAWELVTEYNETYFREMIQSLEEKARHSFINFTDLPGLQLKGPWTRSRTTDLSKAY